MKKTTVYWLLMLNLLATGVAKAQKYPAWKSELKVGVLTYANIYTVEQYRASYEISIPQVKRLTWVGEAFYVPKSASLHPTFHFYSAYILNAPPRFNWNLGLSSGFRYYPKQFWVKPIQKGFFVGAGYQIKLQNVNGEFVDYYNQNPYMGRVLKENHFFPSPYVQFGYKLRIRRAFALELMVHNYQDKEYLPRPRGWDIFGLEQDEVWKPSYVLSCSYLFYPKEEKI